MKFLAPDILNFLPLALLPLVIYFLVVRRALRVNFPGLNLIRKVYERNLRGKRFLRAVVLALRCLAAGLLIFGFARPVLERAPGMMSGATVRDVPISVVVLADLSYSMRAEYAGRPVLDILKDSGLAVISRLGPGDKIAVAAFSDRLEGASPVWETPAQAAAKLTAMRAGWRTTSYRAGLEAAYALLARDNADKKAVIVLTDGFKKGFESFGTGGIQSVKGYAPNVELYATALPAALNNVWAQKISFDGAGLLDSGLRTPPLITALFGSTGELGASVTAFAEMPGTPSRRVSPVKQSDGLFAARFPLAAAPGAVLTGKSGVTRDALAADDNIYLACLVPQAPKLLCLYSDPEFMRRGHGGYFLKSVMGEGVTGFTCRFYDLARTAELNLTEYQGIIVAGFAEIAAPQAEALRRYALAGGNVLVMAGPQSQPSAFRFIEDILPVRPLRIESVFGADRPVLFPPTSEGDFDWTGYQFGDIRAERFMLASLKQGAKQLWRLKWRGMDYPAMAEIPAGKGRVAVWNAGIETAWTDFALKPVFPVWAGYAAARLGDTGVSARQLGVNVGVPFRMPVSEQFTGPLTVTPPEGAAREIRPVNGVYEFDGTDIPGVYRVSAQKSGGAELAFAVNPDTQSGESLTEPQPLPPWSVLAFQNPADDFFARLGGMELFGPALALALALFALEFILAGMI